nr:Chain A, Major prion protein [Oryctolagus cuniculus]
QYSNQNSFV